MFKLVAVLLAPMMAMYATDLPSRKYLNLAAIKTMVAASEAKAKELNVEVTICIVDESGNLLFLEKGDAAWAQHLAVCAEEGPACRRLRQPFKRRSGIGQERQCGRPCFS